jgi:hypothetical protein
MLHAKPGECGEALPSFSSVTTQQSHLSASSRLITGVLVIGAVPCWSLLEDQNIKQSSPSPFPIAPSKMGLERAVHCPVYGVTGMLDLPPSRCPFSLS